MASSQLHLEIQEGPHKGKRIAVRAGLVIGRKEGDLVLNDPKMSVRHAEIQLRDNDWVLVDLGSSNQIKVDGERFEEIDIYSGLQFVVGSTKFLVAESVAESEAVEIFSWHEVLLRMIKRANVSELPSKAPNIRPFPDLLKLDFISGVQYGTMWHIGYGPRIAGASSFDLPLYDEAAVSSCFVLDTAGGKTLLKLPENASATQEELLKINDQIVGLKQSRELRSGDIISFGKTRIRVLIE